MIAEDFQGAGGAHGAAGSGAAKGAPSEAPGGGTEGGDGVLGRETLVEGLGVGSEDGTIPGHDGATRKPPRRPPVAAAFFDLDRTMMAGSSGVFFAKAAFETGMISRGRLARDLVENLKFRLRGSTDELADAVRARVGEMISGVPVRDLARLAPRVLAGVLPRIYPEMLATAYAHQDAGRPAYIVTAASQEMADLLAQVLALDGGLGTRSEIAGGVYTGRPAGPFNYRDGKRFALEQLAEREGIDLGASYAYSDSESDLPMLRAVGHPVAVNPDAELARVAREEGWEVMRLDRLGRHLKLIGAIALGSAAATRAATARGASKLRGRSVGRLGGHSASRLRGAASRVHGRSADRFRHRPSGRLRGRSSGRLRGRSTGRFPRQ